MGDWERPLTDAERAWIASARATTHTLYEGRTTPHRSCGIAMAETYGRPTASYQALRRGGITGCGECGVILGARLVLGEIFGDPDPTGATTPALIAAMTEFEARWRARTDRGAAPGTDIVCNTLTSPYPDFRGPERAAFCTRLSADVSELLAEVIVRNGGASLAGGPRPG